MLEYRELERNGVIVLTLNGNLDALTAPGLKKDLEEKIARKTTRFVVDTNALSLIDSSGVGALVSLFKRVRGRGGDVKIAGLCGQPCEIFKLLRLDRAFDIYDTVDAAVGAFGG